MVLYRDEDVVDVGRCSAPAPAASASASASAAASMDNDKDGVDTVDSAGDCSME